MPQFAPRRGQPPKPDTYRRLAHILRECADRLDETAEAATPEDKYRRTTALKRAMKEARRLWERQYGLDGRRPQE